MEKNKVPVKELILKTLKEKSSMKVDVAEISVSVFENFRTVVMELIDELSQDIKSIDSRLSCEYRDSGKFSFEIKIAGDVLVFNLHSNIFEFEGQHPMWKNAYVRGNAMNSYCGMISVYNFLADSIAYNRDYDLGYLIARIFVNREEHYFVEGKRQLGFLYNDFAHAVLNKDCIRKICESAILYCLEFDLLTPPYDHMKEISVKEIRDVANTSALRTGKRLGFKFQADTDNIA